MSTVAIRNRIGSRLKALYERADITKVEWARRLRISDAAVSQWIKGTSIPRADMLERAVAALGFTMLDFYGDERDSEQA